MIGGNMIYDNLIHAEGNVGTTSRGGGIYRSNSTNPLFVNNTAAGNRAEVYSIAMEGGGIYFTYSNATVANTIVSSNAGSGIHFGSFNIGSVPSTGIRVFSVPLPATWVTGEAYPFQALVGPWGGPSTRLTNLEVLFVD